MRARTRRRAAVAAVAVGVLGLLGATVTVVARDGAGVPPAGPASASSSSSSSLSSASVAAGTGSLSGRIAAAQAALQLKPNDADAWAALGSDYVEQARVTADPTYYPKSETALHRSMTLKPEGNYLALTGLGALANARHDFGAAAAHARAAQQVNTYFAPSYGVLTDALTQLGDYPGATAAAQNMLDLKPGISSFTRGSYDLELHGNVTQARRVLTQALASSSEPGDQAYCHTYLGELAFSTGDLDQAETDYAAGLALTPNDPGLLLGKARVQAARGDTAAAVAGYQHVVDVRPLPGSLVEYGQLLESLGRTAEAKAQFSLFTASEQLFAANGVQDSLTAALLAADHGDGAAAVAAGRAEYATRRNIDAADALGWSLHAAGRDVEALPFAQQATRLGTRNASFLYHRGMIEAGVGDTSTARTTLTEALALNPYFSPLSAPRARTALAGLGGPV